MYESQVHVSLYKKPLLLGLPKMLTIFGLLIVMLMFITASLGGLLGGALFGFVYFRICLRLIKRDTQFFEILARYLGPDQASVYPSYVKR